MQGARLIVERPKTELETLLKAARPSALIFCIGKIFVERADKLR